MPVGVNAALKMKQIIRFDMNTPKRYTRPRKNQLSPEKQIPRWQFH
ncbi:MAG: hypothetical protein JWN76_1889 [Chitinophagaceae bacterium]|nr:hypothetical protein [Chitinophagaceae bacterium]